MKRTTVELAACYSCLAETAPFSADRLADYSRRFETLFVALESRAPLAFRVKPKLHRFQELCEMQLPSRPAAHWTYRDKNFGGSVAGMSASRGASGVLPRWASRFF